MFIFNHDIILWGIDSVPEGIFLFFMTVLGCMSFASLTQGWFIAKNTLPDALLLACSTIIRLYPALLTGFFLPHDQRYWGYLIGIGIMGPVAFGRCKDASAPRRPRRPQHEDQNAFPPQALDLARLFVLHFRRGQSRARIAVLPLQGHLPRLSGPLP